MLADPETGDPLTLVDDDGSDIIETGALMSPTGRRFPIVGGVPRFVERDPYAASFGLQWNRFARVQLDSHTGATYSRDRFLTETGWSADDIAGKWVVDAGCGSGRFAEIAADLGAEIIAVDLSSAVDATAANLAGRPNVHVIQGDIRSLPLRSEGIAHLYSIGVLQHTDDPQATARQLVSFLPTGGAFVFTIYARRAWTKLYAKYLVRPLTRRMRPERLLALIERTMPAVFPATNVLFSLPLVGRVLAFAIPVANYVDRHDLSHDVRYQETILDTFDMLSPRYDQPVTAEEIESALDGVATGLDFLHRVPVVVRGVRARG